MSETKISIVTICYNDAEGLVTTLDSLEYCKSINDVEVVVIDGGSNDNTLNIIKDNNELIDHYISESDSGIYNAMNKGISLCAGEYIIFMNAGDAFVRKTTIEEIIEQINKEPDFDIYYSDAIYVGKYGEHIHSANHELIMSKMPFNHQSTVIRRNLHLTILYNEFYKISSDYDFFLRALIQGASFKKIGTKIARHSLDGISVTSPFHSCVESVHSHLMNFGKISFEKTEYYGEFFIKEIFKKSPLIGKAVLLIYTIFIKKNKKLIFKAIMNRFKR